MKKTNLFSKVIFGLAVLISGMSRAQTSSGYTHATNFTQDCYYGNASWDVDFSLSVHTGGHANFRVQHHYYKGDWTYGSMAARVVTNETLLYTTTSSVYYYFPYAIAGVPLVFTTANFYTTAPHITRTMNGAYRATTTLQKEIGGVWTDLFTTPLSTAYGRIDTPPNFPVFGDIDEVAVVDELNVGTNFSYSINSYMGTPTFVTCPTSPLILNQVQGWMGNPGTATLTVEQGIYSGSVFTPTSSAFVTLNVTGNDQNLTSLFSLANYSGALRVTYRLPDDDCGGVYTPVSQTMIVLVTTAAFLNDYKARVPSASPCVTTGTSKAICTTPVISATMPSSTSNNTFKCELKSAVGWYGAASAGITDLTFAGDYAVDVYEADPVTGARLSGAPSVYLNSGTIVGGEDLLFRSFGNAASFNSSYGPFYVDPASPADATGMGSGEDYFVDYYAYAKGLGATALTNFSAKVFCTEVSQFPSNGCTVTMKSYFRIANNGITGNGGYLRMISSDEEYQSESLSLEIYPNPTKGELIIPVTEDDTYVSMVIMDNLGKKVMSIADVKAQGGTINIENFTAGIYFYTINKDNFIYRGKIVKQ